MIPIQPTLPGVSGLGAPSGTSAARAVVDRFVALLAMAMEPLTASSGGGDSDPRLGSERPDEPRPEEVTTAWMAAPPQPAQVPAASPGPDPAAESRSGGSPAGTEPEPATSGDPAWTPMPSAARGAGAEWTPLPTSRSDRWRPTLPAGGSTAPREGVGAVDAPAPPPLARELVAPTAEPETVVGDPVQDATVEAVEFAPSAPVPHGRARGRSTFPPGIVRSTPIPAQRAAWGPRSGPPDPTSGVPAADPRATGASDEPPLPPPARRAGLPGTDRLVLPPLGPNATPISAEHRAARYRAAVDPSDAGPSVPEPALSTAMPAARGPVPFDPARYVTPFVAYERQQAPKMARTVASVPTTDPGSGPASTLSTPSVRSTADRAPPGSSDASRAIDAGADGPEPDSSSHGSAVAAVPLDAARPDAADAPGAPAPAVEPGGVAPPSGDVAQRSGKLAAGAPTEPAEPPLVHHERPELADRVRVQIDRDLAVEVATRGQRVDVSVTGRAEAVEPLRDLGPELDAGLLASGFQLGTFEASADPSGGEEREDRDEPASDPRTTERTASHRSRFGRYA